MRSLDYFRARLDDYLGELEALVAIETPTRHPERIETASEFVGERLAPFGSLEVERLDGLGPLLHLRCPGTGGRVLLLGHLDTVWPVGSWDSRWRVADGRAHGPGVYDMKGGVLFMPWMLRCLEEAGRERPELELIVNPDEEVGSLGSRRAIAAAAERADFVLVLEPSDLDGNLKLARKGSGEFLVRIQGRAAHQGAEPELGVNAVVEAAHQILRVLAFQDPVCGTTVGPNVVSGGTASNIVADHAEIRIDVRAWTEHEQRRLEAALRALSPVLEDASVTVTGRWNRPPLEASAASIELFERTRELGAGLGLDLHWLRWGGSSDANLAAAAGAAVMDGLGPLGEGAHQPSENILVDAVPARLALLTELVASLAQPPERWLSTSALASLGRGRSRRPAG